MMEHYSPSSIVFQCSSSPPSSAELPPSSSTHISSLMNAAIDDDNMDHFQFNNNNNVGMFPPLMSNTTSINASPQNSEGVQYSSSCKKKGELNEKKVNTNKKPKFAFQTRSQVDILDDGYRWRKYGQKAVKNNRFPRSYYRCTHQGCSVKKQVQRLSKDEGIVVTTYEGMHSHSIDKSTDNFDHILSQMHVYTSF